MDGQNKILLLDDDEQMLELYQALLEQLPSKPQVQVSNSGARAIAMLESEPFNMLITDLRMPKMDGIQVLAIVRRKFPQLRIVVLTGLLDEEYRSRAYAQGVEMFWQKPSTNEEIHLFQDCIESVLNRATQTQDGFRGVQSKSLVDLIQLECLSRSSSVLQISRGGLHGKIWINNGEVYDAATGNMNGEPAFKEIISWKSGNFEIHPGELNHPRVIEISYQGLLLDSAQCLDEFKSRGGHNTSELPAGTVTGLAALGRFEGVAFVMALPPNPVAAGESWSLENPIDVGAWLRDAHSRLSKLGENLRVGELTAISGRGWHDHWTVRSHPLKGLLCVGFRPTIESDEVDQTMKHVFEKWAS